MRTVSILMLVAVVGLVVLPGCGSKVSKSNFDKIEDGMTEAQVKDILGEGKEASAGLSIGGVDVSAKQMVWEDGDKSITVAFKDGKVVGKVNKGL